MGHPAVGPKVEPKMLRRCRQASRKLKRRVAQPFRLFSFPIRKWVPRPCVLCKGGWQWRLYDELCHAKRLASYLRRASPALYHLFVLSPITFSAHCQQAQSLSLHPGTDPAALPLRGRGIRRLPEHIHLLITEQWRWSSYRFYFLDEAGPVRVNEGWSKISFRVPAA